MSLIIQNEEAIVDARASLRFCKNLAAEGKLDKKYIKGYEIPWKDELTGKQVTISGLLQNVTAAGGPEAIATKAFPPAQQHEMINGLAAIAELPKGEEQIVAFKKLITQVLGTAHTGTPEKREAPKAERFPTRFPTAVALAKTFTF
jgi:hypothetical protein